MTTSPDNRRAASLVFVCTIIGAAAQMFIKSGANSAKPSGFVATALALLTNAPLFFGYCLYAVNTVLLILALRKGELSVVYPIIALTYVWVTLLSVMFFHESLNIWKVLGLSTIVIGVSLLGRTSRA